MPDRDDWTPLYHLAYLYAAIASVDGSVSNEELEVLCEKLGQWRAETPDEELMPVVVTAVAALGSDVTDEDIAQIHRSVEIVAQTLDAEETGAVLDDLIGIAGADGEFRSGEGDVLLLIRNALEAHAGTRRHRRDLTR